MANKTPKSRINSQKAINKAIQNWRDYMDGNLEKAGYVHLSQGNTKLGSIMNVSLPPVVTCHNCAGCKEFCYAVRSYNRFPETASCWNENYSMFLKDPIAYFSTIARATRTQRFFRWHVSGDIVNLDYFWNMILVAKDNPNCEYLAFTKAYDIVNSSLDTGSTIPKNLHVLFSAAPGVEMKNPHNLPECHINFEDPNMNTYHGGANYEHHCNGNCTECVINGCGCFFLKNGDVTIIDQH